MRVGMEVAYVEHLMDIVLRDGLADLKRIVAVLDDLVLVRNGVAVDKGHRKDTRRRQIVIDGGAGDLFFIIYTILFEELGVVRLYAAVELFLGDLLHLFDDRDQIDHLIILVAVRNYVYKSRQLLEDPVVLAHHIRDQRTHDLGDDAGAVL